jgi:hypothetical protein
LRKAEAATVVQRLLENQARVGLVDFRPGPFANELVRNVWAQAPHVFDGSRGAIPHKVSVAAAALANGADALIRRNAQDPDAYVLIMCLGQILQDVEQNEYLYPFNKLDEHLLSQAVGTFANLAETLEPNLKGVEAILGAHDETKDSDAESHADETPEQRLMREHGITFQDGQYWYQIYRYDKLEDAVNYSKLVANRA